MPNLRFALSWGRHLACHRVRQARCLPHPLRPSSLSGQSTIGNRKSKSLRFCVVGGGALVLVLVCWFWLRRGPELATLQGHRGMVRSLALSPDGALLASGGEDCQIRVWD